VRTIRLLTLAFLLAAALPAGPVDFGLNEYKSALAARNLKWKIAYEVTSDPPESYRIEPYKYGGAHVTGGDLRGLMYGLLEAAEQIRTTGRLKQVHANPTTMIRGARLYARDANFTPERWRAYFETLARDRFNRFTLIYTEPPRDLQYLRGVTQTAADFGIDFTLALWEHEPDAALDKILAACPRIHTVQVRNTSHDLDTYRSLVLKPLRAAGRRVALDPEPEFAKPAAESGVAIRIDPPSWPPNFDIDGPPEFERHALFYYTFGRVAYDLKAAPPAGQNAVEFRAAAQLTSLLAMAEARSNDWSASISEAVHNRVDHIASAKRTPLETVSALNATAALLAKSSAPDFQLIAKMACEAAEKQRAAYEAELSEGTHQLAATPAPLKSLPRPQISHTPVKTAAPEQAVEVTIQINPAKEATIVRLHYRPIDSAETTAVEKPAAPSVSFTIPGSLSDLLYYFEILNRENTGWFEPDPFTTSPYHVIKIEPKP